MFVKSVIEGLEFDLDSEDTENGRYYTAPTGKKYPSITTVIGASQDKTWLEDWRNKIGHEEADKQTRIAASRGAKIHDLLEKYMLNELSEMKIRSVMPDIKQLFFQMRKYIDPNITKVYALEQALYSHRLKVAGRTDCIADWCNKISIVDWKNSRTEKKEEDILGYFLQATGYSEMVKDITGIDIEQIVVVIGVHEGNSQCFVKNKKPFIEEFEDLVKDFHKN